VRVHVQAKASSRTACSRIILLNALTGEINKLLGHVLPYFGYSLACAHEGYFGERIVVVFKALTKF
jgi:hypothetical protein